MCRCNAHRELRRNGATLSLSRHQFCVALILCVKHPQVVPFWDFFHAMYGSDVNGGPLFPSEAVFMVVRALRKKLADSGLQIIVTSPGRAGGWQLEDIKP